MRNLFVHHSRRPVTGRRFLICAFCLGAASAAGCAPATQGAEGPPPDLAMSDRDMATACSDVMGNLVTNGTLEALAMGGSSPNGQATNISGSASTIFGWTGCCGAMVIT